MTSVAGTGSGENTAGERASTIVKDERVTSDFSGMVSIIRYNSVGFFFTDFVIPYASGDILDASGVSVGGLFSLLIIGSVISAMLAGFLSDRLPSRKKLVFIGATGRGISYLIMYVAIITKSLIFMNVGTFVLGLHAAIYWVPMDALISDKSSKHHRSYAFGRRAAALGQGTVIGGVIGATIFGFAYYLLPGRNWLIFMPLILFSVSNFIGGALFLHRVDEGITFQELGTSGNAEREKVEPIKPLETGEREGNLQDEGNTLAIDGTGDSLSRGFLIGLSFLLFSMFLSAVNNFTGKPFIQLYMLDKIIDEPLLVMIMYAPVGIVASVLGPKLGSVADKLKPSVGITVFSIFGALETLLLVNTFNPYLFSTILVADVVLGSASQLILQNVVSRISIENRGKIIGIGTAMANLGGAVGPFLGGLLWDNVSHAMPFIVTIFIEMALIPFYLIALKVVNPFMAEKVDSDNEAGNEPVMDIELV